ASALAYRSWVLFFSLPLMGMAGLESILNVPESAPSPASESQWKDRIRSIQLTGLAFAVVLILQSLTWMSVTNQLKAAMLQTPAACISNSSVPIVSRSALATWSVTPYSLILQGLTPSQVVLV